MATYSGQVPTGQPFRALRDSLRSQIVTSVVLYFFRRTDGTRGSTADLASIPAGAVIERQVTS